MAIFSCLSLVSHTLQNFLFTGAARWPRSAAPFFANQERSTTENKSPWFPHGGSAFCQLQCFRLLTNNNILKNQMLYDRDWHDQRISFQCQDHHLWFNWTVIFQPFLLWGSWLLFKQSSLNTSSPPQHTKNATQHLRTKGSLHNSHPKLMTTFWGWKTHCIHQQIKLHMDSSPACMRWRLCTHPGCPCPLCGFCQKTWSSVLWSSLPWMK